MNTPKPKYDVILIDDDEVWRETAKALIREKGHRPVKTAGNLYRTRELLNRLREPAILLVDYNMPWMRGTEVIKMIQKFAPVPVVYGLMTGETSLAVKMEALSVKAIPFAKVLPEGDIGVGDYLLKVIEMLEEQLDEKVELFESKIDTLTGAYTWKGGQEICREVLRESRIAGMSVALVFLDGNDFKSINDQFGHDGGDKVLQIQVKEASADVRIKPRPGHPKIHDVIFRLGDEICILLSEIPAEDVRLILPLAEMVAQRVQNRLNNQTVAMGNGVHITPSVSCGVAALPYHEMVDPASDLKRLIKEADFSMYQNKVVTYQEAVEKQVRGAKRKLRYYERKLAKRAKGT